jgi:hypothetical protein
MHGDCPAFVPVIQNGTEASLGHLAGVDTDLSELA